MWQLIAGGLAAIAVAGGAYKLGSDSGWALRSLRRQLGKAPSLASLVEWTADYSPLRLWTIGWPVASL